MAEGRKKNGKAPAPPSDEPDPKVQRNFTDPQSRIVKTKDGYIQGYNAHAAIDGHAQIIVAHKLTPSMWTASAVSSAWLEPRPALAYGQRE